VRIDAGSWRELVLIEGMMGSGKSTTAERLAARLIEGGATARALNESADDDPVRTRTVDRPLGRKRAQCRAPSRFVQF
jgi:predicted kinase